MNNLIINKYIVLLTFVVLLMSSCSGDIEYHKSADVHNNEWTPADSLIFPVKVAVYISRPNEQTLKQGKNYRLGVNLRYSTTYKFTSVPLHIALNNKSYKVELPTKRVSTWGTMIQEDFICKNIPVSFADTGIHSIVVYPDTILSDVYSIGIELLNN